MFFTKSVDIYENFLFPIKYISAINNSSHPQLSYSNKIIQIFNFYSKFLFNFTYRLILF